MKRTYIQPETMMVKMDTVFFLAASNEASMKGDYSDANETGNGGAGVLSRRHNAWDEESWEEESCGEE